MTGCYKDGRRSILEYLVTGQEREAMQFDAEYICDACGEVIVIPIDASAGSSQDYVEDCPVCCHPNEIHIDLDVGGEPTVTARAEQDRF